MRRRGAAHRSLFPGACGRWWSSCATIPHPCPATRQSIPKKLMSASSPEEIRESLKPMWEALARAQERLNTVTGSYWYFAILHLQADFERVDLPGIGFIQRVEEPPEPVFLLTALSDMRVAYALGRYSASIRYELGVERTTERPDPDCFTLAWRVVSALRVRSLAEVLIPAASDVPWAAVAAARPCTVRVLEDMPGTRVLAPPVAVSAEHVSWVCGNYKAYSALLLKPAFRVAAEALTLHQFQASERMMAAHLWAGIEALFNIQAELRFRLAAVIASLLEPRGDARRDLYRRVQRLYDVRSKAVHGAKLSEDMLEKHILEVRSLLSRLLCLCVERTALFSTDDLEAALFG
jgi:hypothetical protein